MWLTNVTLHTLILASGSPRRKELLTGLSLDFSVLVSDVDETVPSTLPPGAWVEELAERKARAARGQLDSGTEALVIAADTIVVLGGQVFGKPTTAAHAKEMLQSLQGRTHEVYTGLCVLDAETGRMQLGHTRTAVKLAPLSADTIARYVASGEPMDKAGAYAIQGIGATLVESIDGDYFTVVGLPLFLLGRYLAAFGQPIL